MAQSINLEAKVWRFFAASAVVVMVLTALTWKLGADSNRASAQVVHTLEVMNAIERTRTETVQIELSTQSFRISGDEARLKERDQALAAREHWMAMIRQQTTDNPLQLERWEQLRAVLDERIAISRQVEQIRKSQGQAAATEFANAAPLAQTRARTATLLEEMHQTERQLLEARLATEHLANRRLQQVASLLSLLLLIVMAFPLYRFYRQIVHIRENSRILSESAESLGNQVQEKSLQLVDAQRQLLGVINNVPALIACVDASQRYLYVNEQYRQCFAPGQPDITGQSVQAVLGDARYNRVRERIERALKGEPQSYDWEPFPGVWQLIRYAPFFSETRDVLGYYVLGTDITERREMEEARHRTEEQLARVLEGSDQGYWDWNLQTNTFEVSARWQTMLGYEPGEMHFSYEHWPELVHPEDLPKALESIRRHMAGETEKHELELRAKTKEGQWRWLHTSGRIVSRTEDGKPLMMSGTHTDIEERKRLQLAQMDALAIFERSYEGIMVVNPDGLIAKVNPSFTRITGYSAEDVVGQSPKVLASGRHDTAFYQDLWSSLNSKGFWHGEIWDKRKSGELFAVLESITTVRDSNGTIEHYVSQFTDITQFKTHELELDKAANYDALTQLPNRRLLSDRLTQSFSRSLRSGKSSAVCFLDLDGFKAVNDQHGHETGDQLLVSVASNLKSILRADDTLARLGGDEFVMLLSEVNSTEECALVLDRVLEAVRQPIQLGAQEISITASIGVSLYPDDNADPDTLLRHADQAMYQAKQAGKNRYQLFDAAIDRIAQQHREFLEQVVHGLNNGEFMLFYQPKLEFPTLNVFGLEALIRWRHPERGLLNPIDFLPQLQGSHVETLIGEWVIDQALQQMGHWEAQGLHLIVSVNVSANHLLTPDFSDALAQALQRHATVPPSRFEIEILETAAIADIEQAATILHQCKALGVQFSLDDFGTGYSSLTYLRQLPIDTLKIDKSFVRDMLVDPEDMGIVKGVIDLARALQRKVVAEGVETQEHGAALQKLGCLGAQGYGISRPMPAETVTGWLARWEQFPWSST